MKLAAPTGLGYRLGYRSRDAEPADFCVMVSELTSLKELTLGWSYCLSDGFASGTNWSLLLNLRASKRLRVYFVKHVDPVFLQVAAELPSWTHVELLCGTYGCRLHKLNLVDLSQLIQVQQLRMPELKTAALEKRELLEQLT